METVAASVMWPGPDIDVLTLFVEPTPALWQADALDDEWQVFVLRALDATEQETETIAGVQIVDFLSFHRWDALPELPMLWLLPGRRPLPLAQLLRDEQRRLREEANSRTQGVVGTG
jgi:hypothetical protein